MPVLLALIGIISFIAVWYWRLKMMSGVARDGLDAARGVANLPRKMAFRHKSGKSGLSVVTDPREAAVVMMLEIARTRGAITAAQETAVKAEIVDHFDFDDEDADALIVQAGWLSREAQAPHVVMSRMADIVIKTPGMTRKDFDDLASMLENVAVSDGHVSDEETDLIHIWRQKAGLN